MLASIRSWTISRFTVAIAAIWIYGAGSAWAGGGGESLTTLQAVIGPPSGASGFCNLLGMGTKFGTTCPQLPTFTQAILEAAGLENSPPEMVAAQNGLPPGNNVYANNPPAVPPIPFSPPPFPLTAATLPSLSDLLSTLTPLAFVSGSKATGPIVTLSTNGATAVGDTTLHLAATKGLITGQAYSIADTTSPTAIPSGTVLASLTGSTAAMSANAAGPGVGSGDKITFTPITNPAAPTQLYDPDANTFLYAVTVSSMGLATPPGGTVPDTLYLFSEDLSRDNQKFTNGQIVAKFSLPLTVLNSNGSENPPVIVTLQIKATCSGGPTCLKAQAVGGIGTPQNPVDASDLGINFALAFAPSPISTKAHAIFEVAVPLLVTGASPSPNTDPAYFYSALHHDPVTGQALAGPINLGIFTAFLSDNLGTSMGTSSIGIAPTAGPLGPLPTCTPTPPDTTCKPPAATFALCASLPDNSNGPGARIAPAVAAYYGIATSGATLLSAALSSTSVCPEF